LSPGVLVEFPPVGCRGKAQEEGLRPEAEAQCLINVQFLTFSCSI